MGQGEFGRGRRVPRWTNLGQVQTWQHRHLDGDQRSCVGASFGVGGVPTWERVPLDEGHPKVQGHTRLSMIPHVYFLRDEACEVMNDDVGRERVRMVVKRRSGPRETSRTNSEMQGRAGEQSVRRSTVRGCVLWGLLRPDLPGRTRQIKRRPRLNERSARGRNGMEELQKRSGVQRW